jgi:hypothetical protein
MVDQSLQIEELREWVHLVKVGSPHPSRLEEALISHMPGRVKWSSLTVKLVSGRAQLGLKEMKKMSKQGYNLM